MTHCTKIWVIFYRDKSYFAITKSPHAFPPHTQTAPALFRWGALLQHFQPFSAFMLLEMIACGYLNAHCSFSGIWKILYFLTIELNKEIRVSLHGTISYCCVQETFRATVLTVDYLFLRQGESTHTIALTDLPTEGLPPKRQTGAHKEKMPNISSGQSLCLVPLARGG